MTCPAAKLAAALQSENLYVMPMPWRDTPGALRITIGSREDTDAVVAGVRRALKNSIIT